MSHDLGSVILAFVVAAARAHGMAFPRQRFYDKQAFPWMVLLFIAWGTGWYLLGCDGKS